MTSAPAGPESLPRRPRFAILGVLMLLMTAAVAALAPAALAHSDLVSSNPVAGSVVPTPPDTIELVFNQDIKNFQPKIAITITGHDPVEIMPTVNGPTVTADLTSLRLPGQDSAEAVTWRVGYRVVSADGHPVAGLLDFSVGSGPAPTVVTENAPPATASTPAEPTPVADSVTAVASPPGAPAAGNPWWWWWIGGALILAVAITAVVIATRRAKQSR